MSYSIIPSITPMTVSSVIAHYGSSHAIVVRSIPYPILQTTCETHCTKTSKGVSIPGHMLLSWPRRLQRLFSPITLVSRPLARPSYCPLFDIFGVQRHPPSQNKRMARQIRRGCARGAQYDIIQLRSCVGYHLWCVVRLGTR